MNIIITDLCKTFDDNEVLKNVNITLKDNSIYCLMGASGIGKTTLLRILMGLEHADSGSISGIDIKSVSCMFQENRLIPDLSAIDNVRIDFVVNQIDKKSVIICYQFFQMIVLICL